MRYGVNGRKRFQLITEIRRERNRPSPQWAKRIRQQARVTRKRLAEEIGVNPWTIVKWETGARRPSGERGRAYYELLQQLQRLAGS